MGARFHIGTSGWHYRHWQGVFYPPALPPAAWLEHYVRRFDTVELNSSFYRLPSQAAVRAWKQVTPAGFRFALKASRSITHLKKLRAARTSLRALLAAAGALGSRCGPLLFQLLPRWHCNSGRLGGAPAQPAEPEKNLPVFRQR